MEWLSKREAIERANVTPGRLGLLVSARVIGTTRIAGRTLYRSKDVEWLARVPFVDPSSTLPAVLVRMAPLFADSSHLIRAHAGWEWGQSSLDEELGYCCWWPWRPDLDSTARGLAFVPCLAGLVVAVRSVLGIAEETQFRIEDHRGRVRVERRVRFDLGDATPRQRDVFGVARVISTTVRPENARRFPTSRGGTVEHVNF